MNKTTRKRSIKAGLKMKGLTYVDIARAVGVSPITVSTIINLYPEKKSYRIQKTLALALGKPYQALWNTPAPRPSRKTEPAESVETPFLEAVVETPFLEAVVE